jgi:hypothetical protein
MLVTPASQTMATAGGEAAQSQDSAPGVVLGAPLDWIMLTAAGEPASDMGGDPGRIARPTVRPPAGRRTAPVSTPPRLAAV